MADEEPKPKPSDRELNRKLMEILKRRSISRADGTTTQVSWPVRPKPKEEDNPMTNDHDFTFGTLRVLTGLTSATPTGYTLDVDRFAARSDGALHLLSVVGPQGTVKSLRATPNSKVPAKYELENLRCTCQGRAGDARKFHKADDKQKFLVHQHNLDFGQVHCLFLAQTPGFLRVISDESLFNALKSTEYTTPILPSWVPAIRAGLVARNLIAHLYCFRCECAVLTAKDEDLDAIVSEGVRSGRMPFRELSLVGEP